MKLTARHACTNWRMMIGAALALGCAVLGGCAQSAGVGWAQTSPLISPEPAHTPTVSLGTRGG
jgi:hypothetical protein